MRAAALVTLLTALAAASAASAAVTAVPIGDFSSPRYVTAPAADFERLFVVENAGRIWIVRDGAVLPEPFLDISDRVVQLRDSGMLSMAFAPDYETSGRFYVFYTPPLPGTTDDCDDDLADADLCPPIVIEEYRRSADDPDRADPASARPLLQIPHDRRRIHYGGQLAFGPDGLLYISTGDDGFPDDTAREPDSLLGKLLRIEPTGDGPGEYSIPAGNSSGSDILGIGLRNPYRFSFDRLTGDLVLGEVGQDSYEEANHVPSPIPGALDFGWPVCEGAHAYPDSANPCPLIGEVEPAYEYATDGHPNACDGSIIGGFVARDPGLEELYGRYLFGDFCRGWVQSITLPPGPDDPLTVAEPGMPVSFGEDACGRLYVVQLVVHETGAGRVLRLEDGTPAPCPPPDPDPDPDPDADSDPDPVDPDPPPAGVGDPDLRPPVLGLGGALRQRLTARGLSVQVSCDEPCRVRALGTLSLGVAAHIRRFHQATRPLAAGQMVSLRLKLPARARGRARRALRAGRRVRAALVVRARDESANLSVRTRRVRLAG